MIVGLYIDDFALLNKITNKVKDKNIKLKHIKTLPISDNSIQVLISKKKIKKCEITQIQPDNLEILELKIRCVIFECSDLVIGIDPGGVTGLSVIGANRILFMDTYKDVKNMSTVIDSINLEIGIQAVKIGTGSPPERTKILKALKKYSSIVQLVDEQNSGSGSHTKAATRIALRKGELNNGQNYHPKKGEIAWVQQESRRISKGLVTIDKELAYEILIGEVSMNQAIKKYTEKIKNR